MRALLPLNFHCVMLGCCVVNMMTCNMKSLCASTSKLVVHRSCCGSMLLLMLPSCDAIEVAIVPLAKLPLLIDSFPPCNVTRTSKKGGANMATNWMGGAAYFIKAGERRGGIDHLCLATTWGKIKDNVVAGCNLVFAWRSIFLQLSRCDGSNCASIPWTSTQQEHDILSW